MDLSGTQAAPKTGMSGPQVLETIEQWLGKRWVPTVINLIVLALLSFSLARGTWRLLTPPPSPEPSSSAMSSAESGAEFNLQALLSANVFGQFAGTKGAVSLDSIPLSSLNLVLTGVMVTPKGSFALISSDGGPEQPFGVEQEIVAGVALYAVYADRVLIRRGGATESLMLKDTGASLPDGSIVMGQPSNRPAPARRGQRSAIDHPHQVSREKLTKEMQRPDFLTQALMVPNAGGGFLVRELQPGSTYEKLGLAVGDVIQSVNGNPVNTMEDVLRLYQQFETAANVEIAVKRAGQTVTLNYNIQ